MKITRYVNGQQREKDDLKNLKISNELITSTIEKVNKRHYKTGKNGMIAHVE